MINKEQRLKALQQFLNASDEDMKKADVSRYERFGFELGKEEYLVLTEEEANGRASEEILNSLWAFQADFILKHCSTYDDMSSIEYEKAKEALKHAQSRCAEWINPLVKALIKDMDEFVEDAIMEDGRGNFISRYDGIENEEEVDGVTYYIYQM